MLVYLIRHSHAVPAHQHLRDEQRFLSRQGRQTARNVGARLANEGVSFDAVLTSPLVRATQTAEILAGCVKFDGVIEATASLVPGAQPVVAGKQIAAAGERIAVVSHEPTVSALGAFLLSLPGFAPFRPCQVCLIRDGQPVWKLLPHTAEIEVLNVR